jgi:ABC-type glycerol-3-phosphate transport system permease component
MRPIKNPIGRIFIHLALWLVVLFSTIPFAWTFLNSLKTKKQAQARDPIFFFKPNLDSFSRLWLDSVPDNFSTLVYGLFAIILILVLISVFAKRLPVSRGIVNWFIVGVFVLILWAIPRIVETAEFYDYRWCCAHTPGSRVSISAQVSICVALLLDGPDQRFV